jgi:hypothetical protein
MMACGFIAMVTPTGSVYWIAGITAACIYLTYHIVSARTESKRGLSQSPV